MVFVDGDSSEYSSQCSREFSLESPATNITHCRNNKSYSSAHTHIHTHTRAHTRVCMTHRNMFVVDGDRTKGILGSARWIHMCTHQLKCPQATTWHTFAHTLSQLCTSNCHHGCTIMLDILLFILETSFSSFVLSAFYCCICNTLIIWCNYHHIHSFVRVHSCLPPSLPAFLPAMHLPLSFRCPPVWNYKTDT